ncbi:restriction endonuclease subunit S [Chromobacterium sinusclupearum]|uniref:Restriction endonuclease subunit S n=1 Tax=Chromobacterium sinusclupearum TaxID=2077146 RepID=A0A2K4MS04_9NEIS|nr:restriction endonuclease subunit S [Chromobacterium sinusclupearum]POA99880.1 restriction endonuclease subunit S [Chromobacterium sinusclupearum]
MSSEWKESTIGAVCSRVFSGGTPASTKSEYYGGDIPWLRTKEVNYTKIYSTEETISEAGLAASSAKIVPVNSVVVAMYGNGDTAGRVAITKVPLTTNQACCNLVIDPSKADYRFIYYYLKASYKALVDLKNGGAQQNLNGKLIKSFPIQVPEVEVQREIGSFLESLDDRITLLRETNATLEAIAQALFKSWFVDFDPVRAKMEGRAPEGMDEATAALFPDGFEESELGLVPRGWRLIRFGQLLSHTIGGDWGSEEPDAKNEMRVAIIRGTDIPDLQRGADSRVPIRYTSAKKLATRKLQAGDIVLEVSGGSKDQPTGRSLFLTEGLLQQFDCPVEPASFCRLLRPQSEHIGILLGQHLTYIYAQGKTWEYQNQSTGIANFQTTHFLEAEPVAVPSDEVLSAFASIVCPMIDRSHLTQVQRLAEIRDTLLPRLISGQLRLPEAEALIA